MKSRLKQTLLAAALTAGLSLGANAVASGKPNILVIMGDDIGAFNISAYNMGMMGYRTPNIDSIAKNGVLFTDWYAQQSWSRGLHHWAVPHSHRLDESGFARHA